MALRHRQMFRRTYLLGAWENFFTKVDRMLTNRDVMFDFTAEGSLIGNIAWTDGLDVMVNERMLDYLTAIDPQGENGVKMVAMLKGLNYHELAHILYTPKLDTPFMQWLRRKTQDVSGDYVVTPHRVWNVLEDFRIERLFGQKYPISRAYFRVITNEIIIKDSYTKWAMAKSYRYDFVNMASRYLLVYGRRHLFSDEQMRKLRELLIASGAQEQDVVEWEDITRQYVRLVLPKADLAARQLVTDGHVVYNKIIQDLMGALSVARPQIGDQPDPMSGDMGRMKAGGVRPNQREQQDINDELDSDPDADEPQPTGGGEDGDSDGDSGEDGSQPGAGEADTDGNGEGDERDGTAGGAGAGDGGTGDPFEKREHVADTMDDIESNLDETLDTDVMSDIEDTRRTVASRIRQGADVSTRSKPMLIELAEDDQRVQARITRVFQRMYADVEPSWLRGERNGRLNVSRYLNAEGSARIDVFDRWDEGGQEEATAEVALLLDISGSMSRYAEELSSTAWIIKRALDKVDIVCHVLVFNSETHTLFRGSERAKANRRPMLTPEGGTVPDEALKAATQRFAVSQNPHRILLMMTDGSWSGDQLVQRKMLEAMGQMRVQRTFIGLGGMSINVLPQSIRSEFDYSDHITSPSELVKLIEKTVGKLVISAKNR